MHIPRIEVRSLDETVEAVDLGQTPADVVFLSFSDSDLNALARAYDAQPAPKPTLRLASLAALRHPYSIDLYLERVCARAKLVVARVLGGADYWRYGVDELAALARKGGLKLALLPGDRRADGRLEAASTLPRGAVEQIWRYFDEGGPANMASCLGFLSCELGLAASAPPPEPASAFGRFESACFAAAPGAPRALIVFYRSIYLANDLEPVEALALALRAKGFVTTAVYVTSLKDEAALAPLRALIAHEPFDVALNATAFSARLDESEGTILDSIDAPVLQVVLAGMGFEAWRDSLRGLGPADLAMHVALPEIDGRILTRAISFKAANARDAATEFGAVAHRSLADRVAFVAELAASWARLRRTAPAGKRLACVLPDYPARGGRTGYAVGLDTPASAVAIAETLRAAGYDVAADCDAPALIAALSEGPLEATLTLAEYEAELASTPGTFQSAVGAAWGEPADDPSLIDGAFRFRFVRLGKLIVAVQPDRGDPAGRKGDYHDLTLAPRHSYVAFHLWLTRKERIDALIQLGAHGTLEWLPGKAVALSEACAPEVLVGPTPVVYPFIVNNPGEAAQAKRRIGAATIGHLTPPLVVAGSYGAALELESLFDEFVQAQALDPRRARAIAALILERGQATGLLRECAAEGRPPEEALVALDGWLCDLKDMRVGDGLHVFGRSPESAEGFASGLELDADATETLSRARRRLRRGGVARPHPRARRALPAAGSGRRAGARPARRAADRAQSLRHRSPLGPDPQRLGDRAPRGRGGARALCPGSWAMAAADRPRSLGLGDDAHRRRRSRAGLRAAWMPSDLGHVVEPRQRLRNSAARHAWPAAGRRDLANLRPLPRRLPEPDRAFRRRGQGRRRTRGKRRRQSAGRLQGRGAGARLRRGAGRLWRRARAAHLRGPVGRARGSGRGLSLGDEPRL